MPYINSTTALVTCEGCTNRLTSADFFDSVGGLLTTIEMNVAGTTLAAHTLSYTAADIGSIQVHLGFDAVQSISFDTPGASVPEPTTVALLGLGLLGFAASRRKLAKCKIAY